MPTTPRRVALYARVSSDQQAKDNTIASQVEALKVRVEADGFALEDELAYLDDGQSGSTLVRPGLERLRDHAAAGAFDRLYIHSPDRLARDYAHQMLLVDELHRCGVELVFINHPLDESPEGRLLLQVQSVVAEYERAKILERARRGKRHAANAGRVSVLGHAPYGYRYVSKQEGDGVARYQVVLEQARVVRQIFEWIGLHGQTLRQVCARLRRDGVLSPGGLPAWNPTSMTKMLQNPAYKGMATFGKSRNGPPRVPLRPRRGATYPGRPVRNRIATDPADQVPIEVPALVEADLFDLVGQRMATHRSHHGRPAQLSCGLLRGLVVCQGCGYGYYVKITGRRKGEAADPRNAYYRCAGTDRSRKGEERLCDYPMVRVDRLDVAVWDDVRALLSEPSRVEHEYERRLKQPDPPADVSDRSLQKEIGQVRRRISRLLEMYEEGYLEKGPFQQRIEAARQRLARLEEEAKAAAERIDDLKELRLLIGCLKEFAGKVREGLESCDVATRRAIIQALVRRVEIGPDKVRVVYRVAPGPFVERPGRGVVQYCQASYKRFPVAP
jgi:site-specific DNA recombinase